MEQPSERFAVQERVGGGAGGDIYRATDLASGEVVALKFLRASATPSEKARFRREIAVIADLRHPNIVDYVAHGEWPDGRLFLAMEWLDGEDLAKRTRRAPLGMRDACEVVRRAAQALAAIHSRGIVHRDLKLSNIYLIQGRGTAIKLIDFGVVKPAAPDEHDTEPGTILGTPHYMAPEQARGEHVDPRADVYALGSVLFRLLTGRNVFVTDHVIVLLGRLVLEDPPHASSLRFDIPEKLDAVVQCALSRDPAGRYANAGDFARALARVGTVPNTPPRAEGSNSQVLPKQVRRDSYSDTGSSAGRFTRQGTGVRRIVACMVYDLGDDGRSIDQSFSNTISNFAGEDVRLAQLAGGKTVAVFGVEHSRGDEVMRAARAAMQVLQDFPQARAVVTTGHAVAGRSNLAGEALERAAKQLDIAREGYVRLDLHAAAALEMRFRLHRDAQGALLLQEDLRDLGPRHVLGQPTPTVGREREISALQSLYAEVLSDAFPRAAIISGPAGIGKSRLRSELSQRLELSPTPPERIVCRGVTKSRTSLSVLGTTLRQLMGVQSGARPDEQVQLVRNYIMSRLPRSLHFLTAFIGELVGVPFPDDHDEPLRAARANEQLMHSRIRMAFEAFIRTQAGRIPQVVMLDDVEDIDETTLDLIGWVLACPDIRLAVFAFGRPDRLAARGALWGETRVLELTLGPLPEVAADRIVATVLPALDGARRHEIVQRAGGNPFALEELVRFAAEGRDDLPLTVQAMVQLRLDRLEPPVRGMLRAASVFGPVFWEDGVAQLLDRRPTDELAKAEAAELIIKQASPTIVGQNEYVFRQAMVRDAAYDTLLAKDRREMHIAVASWLDARGAADLGTTARHYEAGGDFERAAGMYAQAAQQALGNMADPDAALALAERGLGCGAAGGERALLLLTKGRVLNRIGRLTEAGDAAEQATKLVPQGSPMWVEAQRLLASSLIEAGRAIEGDARASWALSGDFAAKLSPDLKAQLLATRVRGLVDLNRPAEALDVAGAAVAAADEAGSRGASARLRALDAHGFALMAAGLPAESVDCYRRLDEAAERAGDVHLQCRARLNMASSLNYLGRYEDAKELLELTIPDVRAHRLRLLEASALHNLGMSLARRGNIGEGIDLQRQAATICDECAAVRLGINTRIYETMMLVWRGGPSDLQRAHDLAKYVMEATQTQLNLQVTAVFVLANVLMALGEHRQALEAAREAHRRIIQEPVEEWDEAIRLCFIEALLATGQDGDADTVLRHAFDAVRKRVLAIHRTEYRQAFTTRNAEVYRLLNLAATRLGLML